MTAIPAKIHGAVERSERAANHRDLTWTIALGAITVAALVLRIVGINRHSFWYDEAVTARMIRSPWIDLLLGRVRDNGNPPLYWLVAKFWAMLFGDAEAALRSLSLMVSIAAIPIFALLAARLFNRTTGLLCAALLAISPLTLELANEARSYALLQLLAIASTWLLLRWFDSRRRGWLIGYCAAIYLACLCHYYAAFLPLAHAMFLLALQSGRRLFVTWCGAMAVTALAGSFWCAAFLAQMRTPDNLSRMGSHWAIQFLATPLAFAAGRTLVWRDARTIVLLAATVAAGLVFWIPALLGLFRRDSRATVLLGSWLILPIGIPLTAALLGVTMFHIRAASIALPAALILVARGILALPRWPQTIACAGIVAISSISIANYFVHPLKDDWRSATPAILSQMQPDGVLLFDNSIEAVSFDYYAQRSTANKPALIVGIVQPPNSQHQALTGVRFDGGRQLEGEAHDYAPRIFASRDVTLALCVPGRSIDFYRELFARHGFALSSESHFHRIDIYHFTRTHD